MMLTDLANVARAAGLKVVECAGWKTRGHGQMTDVHAVVIHHTAGAKSGNAPSLHVVTSGRSDLPGPLCHFLLARDGTAYVVAAGLAYHAGAVKSSSWSNSHAIGIEMEGTGTAAWPAAQILAGAKLARALCNHYGVPYAAVLGHKEVCSPTGRKIDPNYNMDDFRTKVRQTTATKAATGGDGDLDSNQAKQLDRVDAAVWEGGHDAAGTYPPIMHTLAELTADIDAIRSKVDTYLNSKSADDLTEDRGQTAKLAEIRSQQAEHTAQLNAIAQQLAEHTGQTG
jgi:N-acetylmuramoyl-L-alanine amidase-like protein